MKTKITLFVLLMSITCTTFAQNSGKESNPHWLKKQAFFKKLKSLTVPAKMTKSRALDDRLIAEVYEEAMVDDSITYAYSGNRGSELVPEYYVYFEDIAYDKSEEYDFGSTPILQHKSYCTYNGLNQLLTQLDSSYVGTTYGPDFRGTNTYTANNLLKENLQEYWSSSMWVNGYRSINIYTGNNLTTELGINWNGTAWDSSYKTENVYSGNNQIESTEFYYFQSAWEPSNRRIMTYNANNKLVTDEYQTYQASAWVRDSKDSLSYNANNEVILFEHTIWNNNQWEQNDRAFITWVNDRPTVIEFEDWNGTTWDKFERFTYSYNPNGYPTSEVSDVWNGTAYVYDPNNDSYKIRYYYESYNNNVAVNDVQAKFGEVKMYPNPTSEILNIEIEKNDNTTKEIIVLDMKGMVVLKSVLEKTAANAQLSLRELSAGTYIVNINTNNQVAYSSKITKQ